MMRENINFEDLFNWELESDRHCLFILERYKQEEYEWQQWEEEQRNKRLPALIQVNLIPIIKTNETKSKSLAL